MGPGLIAIIRSTKKQMEVVVRPQWEMKSTGSNMTYLIKPLTYTLNWYRSSGDINLVWISGNQDCFSESLCWNILYHLFIVKVEWCKRITLWSYRAVFCFKWTCISLSAFPVYWTLKALHNLQTPRCQFGVHDLAQVRFDVQQGIRTSDLPITRRPALLLELQPPAYILVSVLVRVTLGKKNKRSERSK